jgi:hypothetical protein
MPAMPCCACHAMLCLPCHAVPAMPCCACHAMLCVLWPCCALWPHRSSISTALPQYGCTRLRRSYVVHRVLHDQVAVGTADGQRPPRAPLADDDADDGDTEAKHLTQVEGNGLTLGTHKYWHQVLGAQAQEVSSSTRAQEMTSTFVTQRVLKYSGSKVSLSTREPRLSDMMVLAPHTNTVLIR